jgi:magnesium transporter
MLIFHTTTGPLETPPDVTQSALPKGTSWVDALNPDAQELAFLSRVLKVEIPTQADLIEIESSSRLFAKKDRIFISLPLVFKADDLPKTTPIGFVLSRSILLTLHYEPLKALGPHSNEANVGEMPGSVGHFLTIVECIIDHVADVLEHVGSDLDSISSCIFAEPQGKHQPRAGGNDLRQVLRQVGRAGDLTAKISETLLGIGRMIPYVSANAADYLTSVAKDRLESLSRDIVSLNDYETHLTDKIQLLVDVTLGFTNVDQNNVFRVLTVFSIIGIPPTFLASMYGMNFKTIPEYDWAYGYPYALILMFLSGAIPALWFKWRGWW